MTGGVQCRFGEDRVATDPFDFLHAAVDRQNRMKQDRTMGLVAG